MDPNRPGETEPPDSESESGKSARERADALGRSPDEKGRPGPAEKQPRGPAGTEPAKAAPDKAEPTGEKRSDREQTPANTADKPSEPKKPDVPKKAAQPKKAAEPKEPDKPKKPADGKEPVLAGSGSAAERRSRARLTEKQRIEARKKRREQRRTPVSGNVLSRGVRATGHEIHRTSLFVGRAILSGLDSLRPVGGIVVGWLGVALTALGTALVAIVHAIAAFFAVLGRAVMALDRVITPRRALLTIALVGTGILVVSQFTDYRAIEIGQPGYAGLTGITGAPQVEVKTPVDTHSILLLALAAVALAGAAGTALTGRRQYAAGIALAGAGTLLVALAIDLPNGLDAAEAEFNYAGVKAVLLSGFWLELAAGTVLAVTGLSLLVSPAGRTATARSRREDRKTGARQRAVAGGRA